MAETWDISDLRRAVVDTHLWDFSSHLRKLLDQEDVAQDDVEHLEKIRQSFESLLAALKVVVARSKKVTLPDATAVQFQEHSRFAYFQLERARTRLDLNNVTISKIPRELAPEKPAQAAAPPATPRPFTPSLPKMETPPLPYSPFNPQRTLPAAPDEASRLAAFASEIALTSLQDSINPKDSASKCSSTSSAVRRRKEEEARLKKEELERMNELEREKEDKEARRREKEEEREEEVRKVREEWERLQLTLQNEMEEKMRIAEKAEKRK